MSSHDAPSGVQSPGNDGLTPPPPHSGEGGTSGERGDAHSGKTRTTLNVTMDPTIRGGEPCITGTRVPVSQVVGLLADGVAPERIRDYYPSVEIRDTSTGPILWIGTDNSQPTVMCDCFETPVMWIDGHSVWDVWQTAEAHECEAS